MSGTDWTIGVRGLGWLGKYPTCFFIFVSPELSGFGFLGHSPMRC